MFKNKLNTRITIVGLLAFSSCSNLGWYSIPSHNLSETKSLKANNNSKVSSKYSPSGTLSLSFPILSENKAQNGQWNSNFNANKKIFLDPNNPLVRSANEADSTSNSKIGSVNKSQINPFGTGSYAPLLGFVPVHASFQPADNEMWMELERETSTIRVYKGKEKLKEVKGEGKISLAPGEYPLQHKQKNPLWYAPDEYFEKRQLKIPPRGDHFRYRRGALGSHAIYPTMDFIIHSGPFMSEEIGGLKISDSDLTSIFSLINVGFPIVVK